MNNGPYHLLTTLALCFSLGSGTVALQGDYTKAIYTELFSIFLILVVIAWRRR